MKHPEIINLILNSLSGDSNSEEKMMLNQEVIPDYSFRTGFRESVMEKITGAGLSIRQFDLSGRYRSAFLKIALSGAAAIVILVISFLISQGSLTLDTLLGFDNSVDDGLLSLLIY